jgi:CHAD domain-containing protein
LEIEAKFRIPDEPTFHRLLEATALAGYRLGDASRLDLHDRYLDTADWAIMAWGYTCRLRQVGDRYLATLKGLGAASGVVHRRAEHQVELLASLLPSDWPPSVARDLALRLCGNEPLDTLFEIQQTRHSRPILDGERTVAELSLDHVCICRGESVALTFLELEAELAPDGTEDDLSRLAEALQGEWALVPESRSKFERGLALFDIGTVDREGAEETGPRLTDRERAIVERLSDERDVIARRARLLLAWDDGLPRAAWVERSGLSPRRVRHWLSLFKQRRLGIFPERELEALAEEDLLPRSPESEAVREGEPDKSARRGSGERSVADVRAAVVEEEALDMAALAGDLDLFLEAADEVLAAGSMRGLTAERRRAPSGPIKLLSRPGILPDDSMSEAGRKTFRFHFRRMLYHEPTTRQGEDIEALHDMRVATRRMRAAFQVFGDFYEPEAVARYQKGLKRVGRALGAVRDLDVFREKARAYLDGLPETQRGSLDGFLIVLGAQREKARKEMLAYLNSPRYQRFVERFGRFVETRAMEGLPVSLDDGEPRPHRVRHVAPMVIYERLAAVRAYDEWVTIPNPPLTRLHALRIACKRLRYSLEFFKEVLGPDADQVIDEVVTLQDHLGDLQDAVVASGILRDFLVWGTWGHDSVGKRSPDLEAPVIAPGVASYLATKQSELQHLLSAFPPAWARLTSLEFSGMVAEAILVL